MTSLYTKRIVAPFLEPDVLWMGHAFGLPVLERGMARHLLNKRCECDDCNDTLGVGTMNVKRLLMAVFMMALSGVLLAASPNLNEVQQKIQDKVSVDQLQLRSEENKIILEGRVGLLKDKVEAEEIARKQLKKQEVVNNIL